MGRVYCSSDWHGNLDIANRVFDYLQPDDTLYFLGDCADRGEHGVRVANMLLTDPRVRFIKGNHELFMEEGLQSLIEREYVADAQLWVCNGGAPTIEQLNMSSPEYREWLYRKVTRLPESLVYHNKSGNEIILNHCGYTPVATSPDLVYHTPRPADYESYWDRHHFTDAWDNRLPNTYMVHGHTPVEFFEMTYSYNGKKPQFMTDAELQEAADNYVPRVIRYCNGHKFNIDLGTAFTGRAVLLDLDSFEEIYIEEEGE